MIFRHTWVICLLYSLLICSVFADDTPQDLFFKLYFTLTEAERSEKQEDYVTAQKQYDEVRKGLEEIKRKFPDWEPGIINFRTKYVHDKLANLKDKLDAMAPVAPPTPPAPKIQAPTSTDTPTPDVQITPASPEDINYLHRRISDLETQLSTAKKQLDADQIEIASLRTRLDSAEKELTAARSSNVEERVASILKENNDLKQQLNDATMRIKELQNGSDATALAQLKDQLTSVQYQLTKLADENQSFQTTNGNLKQQLELAQQRLTNSDNSSGKASPDDSIVQENAVLRKIVTQQLREQARRDSAKRLAEEEINNLQIKSDILQKQIEILSSPLVNIPPDELAMLRLPVTTSISAPLPEENHNAMTSLSTPTNTTTAGMGSNTTPATTTTTNSGVSTSQPAAATTVTASSPSQSAPPQAPSDNSTQASPTSADGPSSGAPAPNGDLVTKAKVPDDMHDIANRAADLFKRGHDDPACYDQAAALYNQMIDKYPDCLYAWSNLGVVRFEQQKYPEAEKALEQAIKLNPDDAFAHSILGIVFYQMGRFDEAIDMLTRSIALDPKDARSENYLGIACSQKGWQEAAEKSLHKAIDIDPNYGDAHFNLAVIYATQKPPMTELAKKHYKLALDLGIPKDPQLEKLLNP